MHEHYSTVTAQEKLSAAELAFAELLGPAKVKENIAPTKVGDEWGTKWGTQDIVMEAIDPKLLN